MTCLGLHLHFQSWINNDAMPSEIKSRLKQIHGVTQHFWLEITHLFPTKKFSNKVLNFMTDIFSQFELEKRRSIFFKGANFFSSSLAVPPNDLDLELWGFPPLVQFFKRCFRLFCSRPRFSLWWPWIIFCWVEKFAWQNNLTGTTRIATFCSFYSKLVAQMKMPGFKVSRFIFSFCRVTGTARYTSR